MTKNLMLRNRTMLRNQTRVWKPVELTGSQRCPTAHPRSLELMNQIIPD